MIKITLTDVFDKWLSKLKDRQAKYIINTTIRRISLGNLSGTKSVGRGIHEKRIAHGPGYRLYFFNKNQEWIIILCGGDKSSQQEDIKKAIEIKKGLK